MKELVVKYYFQNGVDNGINYLFLKNDKDQISNVEDIQDEMLRLELITENCYLRFKDFMYDMYTWVDIKNTKAPLPINSKGEVAIKILKTPYKLITRKKT